MQDYKIYSERVQRLAELSNPCSLCPRKCGVNRSRGEAGFCGIGEQAVVSSVGAHFGEESVLVGSGGSGTIFFAGCNLGCIFCQNYDISHLRRGSVVTIGQLADFMLDLQAKQCSNINLVTPTHLVVPIAAAIESAKQKGLVLPVVYNSGGYDSVETLKLLDGMVDIYMPDMKFSDSPVSEQLCNAADYPAINFEAVREMHRQVGELVIKKGIAVRGLLIRHLVLPDDMAGSFAVMDFLVREISSKTMINVMDQYRPCYKASLNKKLNRRPTVEEIEKVRSYAVQKGLRLAD